MSLNERILGPVAPEAEAEPERESVLQDRIGDQNGAVEASHGDPYAALKTRIHSASVSRIGPRVLQYTSGDELLQLVNRTVSEMLALDPTPLSREERQRLVQEIANDILGYGPLEPYLADTSVTEIMVNDFDRIYIERGGRIVETDSAFIDQTHLLRIIDRIVSQVGRRIDESSPMVDARLPDGSRVNAVIPPLTVRGPALTIRKFSHDYLAMSDLVAAGELDERAAAFLGDCVRGKLNILISGGTGAGKTTLLNALSAFIPHDERIVTIEDAAELQLQQHHVIPLESRPPNVEGKGEVTIRDLVRNALRMRPDRIVVGEVRGPETLDMLQAMNTGHEGSLSTIHANTPRDALSRLEMLVLTAGVDLPLRAIREQIASAFDLLVHITRLVDGTRRISHVTEVLRMEGETVTLQDLFVARAPGEEDLERTTLLAPLAPTGLTPRFVGKLAASGVTLPNGLFEPDELSIMTQSRRRHTAGGLAA